MNMNQSRIQDFAPALYNVEQDLDVLFSVADCPKEFEDVAISICGGEGDVEAARDLADRFVRWLQGCGQ